jgi:hypothetical protein
VNAFRDRPAVRQLRLTLIGGWLGMFIGLLVARVFGQDLGALVYPVYGAFIGLLIGAIGLPPAVSWFSERRVRRQRASALEAHTKASTLRAQMRKTSRGTTGRDKVGRA